MNRREFLTAIGATAAAVTLNGLPCVVEAETADSAGWGSLALQRGDVFTSAGRYSIDPVTRKATKHLQQFVITQVYSDRVDIQPQTTIAFKPSDVQPLGVR